MHGDIGPLLAFHIQALGVSEAPETARATVIGAGMQNTEVSGSTVYIKSDRLPLKNVPIVDVPVQQEEEWEPERFQVRVQQALKQASTLLVRTILRLLWRYLTFHTAAIQCFSS